MPSLSLIGGVMSVVTYLITLMFTTPGVAEPLAGGFPACPFLPDSSSLRIWHIIITWQQPIHPRRVAHSIASQMPFDNRR